MPVGKLLKPRGGVGLLGFAPFRRIDNSITGQCDKRPLTVERLLEFRSKERCILFATGPRLDRIPKLEQFASGQLALDLTLRIQQDDSSSIHVEDRNLF